VSENYFSTSFLERRAEKRCNEKWIEAKLADKSTLFLVLNKDLNLFSRENPQQPVYLSAADFKIHGIPFDSAILLGTEKNRAFFAADILDSSIAAAVEETKSAKFTDLKKTAALLAAKESALLAFARAMVYWHSRQRFCGTCGSRTISKEAGNLLQCVNKNCGQSHFPRTDPAIIVLVSDGDRCLLGSQPPWPENMFSTIAGFVEPGESLEQAVKREVQEETNIEVSDIKYISSQPWPFPSSLMLGFSAKAVSDNININDNELEEARWFSRQEIAAKLAEGSLKLPSRFSIAYRLIETWFDDGEMENLKNIFNSIT